MTCGFIVWLFETCCGFASLILVEFEWCTHIQWVYVLTLHWYIGRVEYVKIVFFMSVEFLV